MGGGAPPQDAHLICTSDTGNISFLCKGACLPCGTVGKKLMRSGAQGSEGRQPDLSVGLQVIQAGTLVHADVQWVPH